MVDEVARFESPGGDHVGRCTAMETRAIQSPRECLACLSRSVPSRSITVLVEVTCNDQRCIWIALAQNGPVIALPRDLGKMDFPHPGRTPSVIASFICPRDHRAEDDDVSAGSRDPNRKRPSAVGRRNNEFLLWNARPNQDPAFISGAPVRIGR